VRRGGTISLSGVYGGMVDPLPMMTLFDKQVQLRMGQANVKRWVPDILPLLTDDDPLGVDDFATHRLPLEAAPGAYADFQAKNLTSAREKFEKVQTLTRDPAMADSADAVDLSGQLRVPADLGTGPHDGARPFREHERGPRGIDALLRSVLAIVPANAHDL